MDTRSEVPVERGKYHEFQVLWTTNVRQKLRKWNDGYLRFHKFNRKALLYDEGYTYICDTFLKSLDLCVGEEINIEDRVVVTLEEDLGWKQMEIDSAADKARKQRRANLAEKVQKTGLATMSPISRQSRLGTLSSPLPRHSETPSPSVSTSTPSTGLNDIIQSSQLHNARKRRIGLTRSSVRSENQPFSSATPVQVTLGSLKTPFRENVSNTPTREIASRTSKRSVTKRVQKSNSHLPSIEVDSSSSRRLKRATIEHADPENLGIALSQTMDLLTEKGADESQFDTVIELEESDLSSPLNLSDRPVLCETTLNSSDPNTFASSNELGPWSKEAYDLFDLPGKPGENSCGD